MNNDKNYFLQNFESHVTKSTDPVLIVIFIYFLEKKAFRQGSRVIRNEPRGELMSKIQVKRRFKG